MPGQVDGDARHNAKLQSYELGSYMAKEKQTQPSLPDIMESEETMSFETSDC